MEVKEYDEIYNVVADQNYPDGITKNQKDALRNKAKKFAIRDGLLYYCDKKRGERQVGDVCLCVTHISRYTHSKSSTATGCCRLWSIYAVAYAFHAARGDSLEDIEFEQDKMRQHLARCLTKQKLTPFPHSQRRARVPPYPWFPYWPGNRSVLHLRNARMPRQHDTMNE